MGAPRDVHWLTAGFKGSPGDPSQGHRHVLAGQH